ncbi:hypothetical protein K432DRAFT_393194 [Lepidopterella palustris CBS 459.81]|uniref:Uncharacterized protein n=1 Tax=Lepidopterella palustris CBS 459.81 TaxID=1314670 RepID=A0A8E2EA82_9PEZI|nr:hypothetical protein K432DRAFT_393194 [Lepidopterella palustris CBS 459.81]
MADLKLTYVFDVVISGGAGFAFEPSEYSNLCVANVSHGVVKDVINRSEFKVTSASDWMKAHPTGCSIDACIATEGPDGNLDLQYFGEIAISAEAKALFQGESKETQFGEGYYYTNASDTKSV